MKIALVSDIHGNLGAFEAVLGHIQSQGVDEIWDLGDSLGFCAFPDGVVALLREKGIPSIMGNYDLKIIRLPGMLPRWEKEKSAEKLIMWTYTRDRLSSESLAFVTGLPGERRFFRQDREILAVHASPGSDEEHLGPDTPPSRFQALALASRADIVVCGHSHRPFVRNAGDMCFINPGSVGLQDDGDPRASYAVVDLKKRSLSVSHHRVAYDAVAAADSIRENGLPEIYARMVLAGRSYRDLKQEGPLREGPSDRAACVAHALELGRTHSFDEDHGLHASALSIQIFDGLTDLHCLADRERTMLECAGILHDIGSAYGDKGHHKRSMELILSRGLSGFDPKETLQIALISRYHRKACPTVRHARFAGLTRGEQEVVVKLSSMLRVADGLDRTHRSVVDSVTCTHAREAITLTCSVRGAADEELRYGLMKSDLMQAAFQRPVELRRA